MTSLTASTFYFLSLGLHHPLIIVIDILAVLLLSTELTIRLINSGRVHSSLDSSELTTKLIVPYFHYCPFSFLVHIPRSLILYGTSVIYIWCVDPRTTTLAQSVKEYVS